MKLDDFKKYLNDYTLEFNFVVNGQNSGIDSEVHDSKPILTLWYGDKYKNYDNPEVLLSDPYFDGKSLEQLLTDLDIEII